MIVTWKAFPSIWNKYFEGKILRNEIPPCGKGLHPVWTLLWGVYCSSLLFNISAVGVRGERGGWETFCSSLKLCMGFSHPMRSTPFSIPSRFASDPSHWQTVCTVDVFSVLRPYWSAFIPHRSFFVVVLGQVFLIHWESVFSLANEIGAPIPYLMIGNFSHLIETFFL